MRDRYNMSLLRNQQDDGNTSSINATNTAVDSEDNPRELAVIPGKVCLQIITEQLAPQSSGSRHGAYTYFDSTGIPLKHRGTFSKW